MQINMVKLSQACACGLAFGVLWYLFGILIYAFAHLFLLGSNIRLPKVRKCLFGVVSAVRLVLFAIAVVLFQYVAYDGKMRGIIPFFILLGWGGASWLGKRFFEEKLFSFADSLHTLLVRGIMLCLAPFFKAGKMLFCALTAPIQKVYLHLHKKRATMSSIKYNNKVRASVRARMRESIIRLAQDGRGKYERDSQSQGRAS